eukprot:204924_1
MLTDVSTGAGFVCVAIAVIFFGSNYAPAKKFNMGDGMFFQWCMCCGIWLVGLIVNGIQASPKFEMFVMFGGALWATGNVFVIPIIDCIGMSMGLLVWGSGNLLMGWSLGNWGLFGLDKNPATHIERNYIGVLLCLAAAATFVFIRPTKSPPDYSRSSRDYSVLSAEPQDDGELTARLSILDEKARSVSANILTRKLSHSGQLVFGYAASAIIGVMYGCSFVPAQYYLDTGRGSSNILDYVFSHFTGLFLASTLYFFIYCMVKGNQPWINTRSALPALSSGIMWAVAQTAWFVANNVLSYAVAFPMITSGPGLIG